jgi:hypothetical protein
MKMINKKIFAIALSVTIIHFVLTSVIGHYIAVKIGAQAGQIVAGGFIEAYEKSPQTPPQSDEEAKRICRDMKRKSEEVTENWKLPHLLISLPLRPLLNPFLRNMMHARIKMVISKEISREQFYSRGVMIDYAVNFINSFFVGFLVYVILRILKHYKTET